MRAEILAIGDELTSGQRLDTNSQWLSQRLGELGIDVALHTTAGDDLEDDVAAFRTAIERADVVVSTGGLGPTADDLTRQAIALAAGVELVQDEAALAHIRALFARRKRAMPERNVLQAQFPSGSRPIPNPHGTAPGIEMSVPRGCGPPCRLFALPGVPAELYTMWTESVAPALVAGQTGHRVIRHRCLKCFGAGESDIEAMLPDMIRRDRQPRVGITASGATITLRVTAAGENEATCYRAMEPTLRQIRELLGTLVYGEEDDELQHVVVRLLGERRQTVAVAEWATEGQVAHWLGEVAGANACFRGGVVVCDAAGLQTMLGVEISSGDGADAETTAAMARAIRERCGADYGLAIAAMPAGGRAIPTAAAADQPENDGTLHVALATSDSVQAKGFPLAGHPAITKTRSAKQALNMLRLTLSCG